MKKLRAYLTALRLRRRIYKIRALTNVSHQCQAFCDALIASDMMFDEVDGSTVITIQVRADELREFMAYMGGLHNSRAYRHNELVKAYIAAALDTNTTDKMKERWDDNAADPAAPH